MDGLMVDTEPLARRAWESVVAPYGKSISDDLYGRMIGRRTEESTRIVRDELSLPVSAAELAARKTAEFLSSLDGGVPAMPGLWPLLDRIEAMDMPWAVATSSQRPVAEIVLGKLGVFGRFRTLACGDEVENGKPAPDIFLLAAERLQVAPENCLALEDSGPGCQAAAAAGMRVAVVNGNPDHEAFTSCAYRRYRSLVELPADLEALLNSE
jgi:HAD superfamily hydrolase (TIGR01509 family)